MAGLTRWAAGTIALLMLVGVLAAGALARVARPDRTPPTFAGLKSETTCVPGPIDGQAASYQLSWDPATDDVTPPAQIVYDIYQATKAGGEDFSSPTYTVRHGATAFATPRFPQTSSSTSSFARATAQATAMPIGSSARA